LPRDVANASRSASVPARVPSEPAPRAMHPLVMPTPADAPAAPRELRADALPDAPQSGKVGATSPAARSAPRARTDAPTRPAPRAPEDARAAPAPADDLPSNPYGS